MIHLALTIASFLFLCWVAFIVLGLIGFGIAGLAEERKNRLEAKRWGDSPK